MATYKLGKHPPIVDDRTLKFADYTTTSVQSPPQAVHYYDKVAKWPLYYNSVYGDCTCAAAAHMIQNWTANAGKEVTVPDQSVLKFYEHFVGSPPPADAGCNMLPILKYWRKRGLDDHKIHAFASVKMRHNQEAKSAIHLTGGIYIGVSLPDFTLAGDMETVPWVVPHGGPVGDAKPNTQNGHCIPAVGYTDEHLWVVTWGTLKQMTWEFYSAYADECYAVVSPDFIEKTGVTKDGLDLQALDHDLAKL